MAEVSLTIWDVDAEHLKAAGVEMDYNEVTVTRRVYRDGGSDYFVNKTPCRLRDIQQLFMGTGMGRASYSIMAQGNITQILSSKPEDRRMVFEEAAGITKFKAQKREALRKLEYTEQNLLRVGDLIREVKRQIGSLQRQAGNKAVGALIAGQARVHGLVALSRHDRQSAEDLATSMRTGHVGSHWAVIARRNSALGSFLSDPRWTRVSANGNSAAWTDDFSNVILTIVNMDYRWKQAGFTQLAMGDLGLAEQEAFTVEDLLTGNRYHWSGPRNYVELHPSLLPAHIFRISRAG